MAEFEIPQTVRWIGHNGEASPRILVVGTLDTKFAELCFLADAIDAAGGTPILLDSSLSGEAVPAATYPVIGAAEVAGAAGSTLEEMASLPRGEAGERMQAGVRAAIGALVAADLVRGAICIGGAGAHVVGPAFRELPIGFPKMVVSPLTSGQRRFEPYVGLRDVATLHSVADIAGINEVTEKVLRTAAGYIVGASRAAGNGNGAAAEEDRRPAVAVSMNGNTTKALDRARAQLEAADLAVVVFHANGVGGRAFEQFVADGRATLVLDYTTTELAATLVGGLMDAGPGRMETAGRMGVPQVLVPGCVDFITCGRWEEAAEEFPDRVMFRHNPELTLVRLTREEMAELGALFAAKANKATGPTSILVPKRGFSVPDAEGGVFWDPEADAAFVDALLAAVRDGIQVEVIDAHINDDAFADAAVQRLLALAGLESEVGA
ncbi:MAG: Tm-1-like ATP-binding domain-containing protein [Solirubrobacterales bacterium]